MPTSTNGTADEQTQASWQVQDLASKLVETGDALHAWFVDPGNNTLGINQTKSTDDRMVDVVS